MDEIEIAARHALGALTPILDELGQVLNAGDVCSNLRAMVDSLPVPAWIKSAEGDLLHKNEPCNQAWPDGCTPHEARLDAERDRLALGGCQCFFDAPDAWVCHLRFNTAGGRVLLLGVSVPKNAANRSEYQAAALPG